jgi:hypothetical protein
MEKYNFTTVILLIFISQFVFTQVSETKTSIQEFPFNKSLWSIENKDGLVQPMDTTIYNNKSSLHLPLGHVAYLKNKKYKNFIIEFDVIGFVMPGFGFRMQDKNNYELIYIRVNSNNKKDAIQYIPIYNGSLPWQLYNYPKYEAKAQFPKKKVTSLPLSYQEYFRKGIMNDTLRLNLEEESIVFSKNAKMQPVDDNTWLMGDRKLFIQLELKKSNTNWDVFNQYIWTHVKVKVLGDQALIYVEDMSVPKLVINHLKQNIKAGDISLRNQFYDAFFANVSIGELKVDESVIKEKLPSNYLTNWELSRKFTKNENNLLFQLDSLEQNERNWKTIKSDKDGLVNISRFFDETIKTVVLRCNIISEFEQSVKMNFDYANHLMMVLNSKVIFNKGINSENEGRVFVDDINIELNLSKGKNKLMFVITADDFKQNWGFIAKLESLNGISIK